MSGKMKTELLVGMLCAFLASTCLSQTSNDSQPSSTSDGSTPKPDVEEVCAQRNSSCDDCVKYAECLWCSSKFPHCIPYPTGDIIPGSDTCDLSDARWGVCWVNYEILLICMGTLGGVILISLVCCIYCCCCRTNKAKQRKEYQREEARNNREREEREMKHKERKAERREKYDEIRKKYGLIKDDNPYQRFDEA